MKKIIARNFICQFLAVTMLFLSVSGPAVGAMFETRSALGGSAGETVESLDRTLASAEVRDRLVELGVDPGWAEARVAALSPAEIAVLEQRMAELPAGAGAIEVIGIVFLVLLILELVGVIDIFKSV